MRQSCGSHTDLGELDARLEPVAREFVEVLANAGLRPMLTSVVRTPDVQQCLHERYLSGESKYLALAPGKSLHEVGLAFDLTLTPMRALAQAGRAWEEAYGGEWGGHVGDVVHFQMKRLRPGKRRLASRYRGLPDEPLERNPLNPVEVFYPSNLLSTIAGWFLPGP